MIGGCINFNSNSIYFMVSCVNFLYLCYINYYCTHALMFYINLSCFCFPFAVRGVINKINKNINNNLRIGMNFTWKLI